MNCQLQSQPKDRHRAILGLAASFAGFGAQASGLMRDDDGGLDFVAVLSTRTATARRLKATLVEQLIFRKRGWMNRKRAVHGEARATRKPA